MSEESNPGQSHLLNVGNRIIQGLWIGPKLSIMEQLSIASFLQNGHDYHLYIYNELPNVPKGAVIRDASEILPASAIFQYKDRPSYAGFSNFFRYKLLLERGGWWADSDVVCLRPFDFPDEYVFGSELTHQGDEVPNVGFVKAPAGSAAMAVACEESLGKDRTNDAWGERVPR